MEYLKKLSNIKSIRSSFSTKTDGNMSFNWGNQDEVVNNRKSFLKSMNISSDNCVVMNLQHSTDIKYIDSPIENLSALEPGGIKADCLITDKKGLFLFLLTGDCLPVIIHDPRQGVIALAHISRKNSGQLFAKNIINKLTTEFNCQPANLEVGIGPCIHKESYIKNDIPEQELPAWQDFLSFMSNGKVSIDLIGFNKRQMIEAGILPQKIEVSDMDTAQSKEFFSHRRSETTGEPEGRFATIAGLV